VPTLIALSADLKARYVAAGFPAERIVVVPNMLDEPLFAAREATRTGNGPAELSVLTVGQLDHRKGVHELVAAYGQLPAEVQARARLKILGAGKDEGRLRELIDQCGIGDRVTIRHCPYDELPDEYAAADLFVKPACWPEPFGRTCLEALAFGLPVLAADVPSAREVLGSSAAYYRPFDVDDLAANLRRLIESDELRRGTASGATDRLGQYRPSKIVNAILGVYETCCGRPE
jgi:glycosyltransferase involved in cell wall biosynthesis